MKKLFLIIVFTGISLNVFAAAKFETITLKVNGMVCEFCAESVTKVFNKYESVNHVGINLDEGTITLLMTPGKTLTDEELKDGVYYAGYDLVDIKRETHE